MSLAIDNMSSHSDVTSLMIIFPASSSPCTIACLSAPGYLHRRKSKYVGASLLLLQYEPGQSSPRRDSSDHKSTLSDVSSISLPFWILMTVIDSLGCLFYIFSYFTFSQKGGLHSCHILCTIVHPASIIAAEYRKSHKNQCMHA